jgi:outer membrane protein TolC
MTIKNILTTFIFIGFYSSFAQELLTKENAISLALENNYGIKLAKNSVEIAKNNASVYNSSYLPKLVANAGVGYDNDNAKLTLQNGTVNESNGSESTNYNASVGLNYTLFDGLGRSFNYKRLQEIYNLTELEAKTIIQNEMLQVFVLYYEVARITENQKNIVESLEISKSRLTRVKYGFDYGQNTKLQILNAEVDVNNDSIRFVNEKRLLANAKRDLNLRLGREVTTDFTVDVNVEFNRIFEYNNLLTKAIDQNFEIQKIDKSIEIGNYDIKISKSDLYPSLNLVSSYGLTQSNNDSSFNYSKQQYNGFNAGINLNWNIFDGGTTKTRINNTKIIADNLQIQKDEVTNSVERNVANALEIYNNSLFNLKAEEKNVETNNHNFERSAEQFKIGQITSIEFRLAQVNLLNAKYNLNDAKYKAKTAELALLQLTGELLEVEY